MHHDELLPILINRNEAANKRDFYQDGEKVDNPEKCCTKLKITGTVNKDPWYQNMMGEFKLYKPMPTLKYKGKMVPKEVEGKYPVYLHKFQKFTPSNDRPYPPPVYLYYYINENPNLPEHECKKRGCWIISKFILFILVIDNGLIIMILFPGMYDATPGNYWFGKKWYHINVDPVPKCPENLTKDGKRFIDQHGKEDPGLTIECAD